MTERSHSRYECLDCGAGFVAHTGDHCPDCGGANVAIVEAGVGDRSLADFDRLEREVGEWADENFGEDQPDVYPLVGAAEEIGEIASLYTGVSTGRMTATLALLEATGRLCHSVLKQAQGIRGDDEDVGAYAEFTAIDDILDAAYWLRENRDAGPGAAALGTRRDVGELVDGIGDVNVYLADFTHRAPTEGATLGDCVEYAWYDEVIDREWDADVTVGDGGGDP